MRPAILLVLLALSAPLPARAALFGKASERIAGERLAAMHAAFDAGDCAAVVEASGAFLGEKPPRLMREEAYGYLGQCYETGGLTDKAISLYKVALELFPENTLFSARLAGIYNNSGFYESAAQLFLKILALKSGDIGANLGLARAYSRLGFLGKAGDYYSKTAALQNFSDAQVLREYASCLLKRRDWAAAAALNAKGAKAEPGAAFWPLMSARALAGQGDYRKAALAMDESIRLGPSRQGRLERALYLLLGGDPAQAIAAADAELAAGKPDALAASVKALALYSMGETRQAEPYFSAAAAAEGTFTGRLAAAFLAADKNGGAGACKK
ncbi:MAG TPA: tetratricopeptide repeat protein [Elusimicrobiales bacterium]|nr:tetratricopeptide repeat protein [Elusimicrobiales bacterium]